MVEKCVRAMTVHTNAPFESCLPRLRSNGTTNPHGVRRQMSLLGLTLTTQRCQSPPVRGHTPNPSPRENHPLGIPTRTRLTSVAGRKADASDHQTRAPWPLSSYGSLAGWIGPSLWFLSVKLGVGDASGRLWWQAEDVVQSYSNMCRFRHEEVFNAHALWKRLPLGAWVSRMLTACGVCHVAECPLHDLHHRHMNDSH